MTGLDCPIRARCLGHHSGAMLDLQMASARLRDRCAREGLDATLPLAGGSEVDGRAYLADQIWRASCQIVTLPSGFGARRLDWEAVIKFAQFAVALTLLLGTPAMATEEPPFTVALA